MGGFALKVSNWAAAQETRADELVRQVVLDIYQRIVVRSPVDTGRFRNNWQIGVGAPANGTFGAPRGKVGQDGAGRWRDQAGRFARAPTAAMVSLPGAGHRYFITNNLPYARRLEYGWSKQAPEGMVRITVAEFDGIANVKVSGI